MPIPYMGSKRKSAGKIYSTIKNFNPSSKVLVDLFCGGFAIGEYFMKNGWYVIANDKNKYVTALLDRTINKGLAEDIVTRFVSRGMYKDIQSNPDDFEDWYVGFVQCIWSFGNNQSGYLFGKEVEPIKYVGHKLVIDKDPTLINQLNIIPNKYIQGILKQDTWGKRRIALVKVAKSLQNRNLELQQLQQLQQLERLEQLEIYNLNYHEVKIPKGAVVYCDPPYKGTAEYKEGRFDHETFWQWVREQSQENNVYVSEYSAPEDFRVILEFSQKSTLQGGSQKHNNQPTEKLFVFNG